MFICNHCFILTGFITGSWVSPAERTADSPTTIDLQALQQEKDQKIARLTEELGRLQAIQKDNERKNAKIGKELVDTERLRF